MQRLWTRPELWLWRNDLARGKHTFDLKSEHAHTHSHCSLSTHNPIVKFMSKQGNILLSDERDPGPGLVFVCRVLATKEPGERVLLVFDSLREEAVQNEDKADKAQWVEEHDFHTQG